MKYRIEGRSVKESFDNLPAGVCFADSVGIIVLCNRQMHRLCHVLMETDLQHIFELRDALHSPKGGVSFVDKAAGILRFPDGNVWEFRESLVNDRSGKVFTQVQALLLTELYAKKLELERKNSELEEVNRRAKFLYETLDKTVRKEEAFAIKMRVHGDIGLRLLSTQKVLREGGLYELQEAGKIWKSTLHVLDAVHAGMAEMTCMRYDIDLILMDVCTENNESGIDACAAIKRHFPEIKVIVVTSMADVDFISRAHEANEVKIGNAGSYEFTEREPDVLRLIVRGMSDAAIAEELFISVPTVCTHISELFRKTGYNNRVKLACDVINKDLIVEGF